MEKTIICIGREYGSGGHEIGELLAKRTGYAFYDKEKLFEIAKMRGYEKEMQEYLDEQPVDSLLYSIAMNFAEPKKKPYPFKLIEELVEEGPCIIMGRCAGYLMRNREEAFSVFVHADMETRIERVKERDHITSRMKAKRKIQDVDEKRSAFRKDYTGQEWGMSKNYDLSVSTTELSYEQAADLILYYKKMTEEFTAQMEDFAQYQRLSYKTMEQVRRLLSEVSAANTRDVSLLANGRNDSMDKLADLIAEQDERQQALLEEINKNMKELSKAAQKGKFGLFR